MTIEFIFGERESLTGKSEYYKSSVRKYLESLGFSQTTDSYIEGTFQDMVFYNPTIAPGTPFFIEVKAEETTLKSKELAEELVKYFKLRARAPIFIFISLDFLILNESQSPFL